MQEDAKMYKEDDKKETDRLSKKNKLLTACVNIRYMMRVEERFTLLSESEKAKMEKKCQTVTVWVHANPEAAIGAFEDKEAELRKHWTALSKQANVRVSALGEFTLLKIVYTVYIQCHLYNLFQMERGGGKKTGHTRPATSMRQKQKSSTREEEKPTMKKHSSCSGKPRVLLRPKGLWGRSLPFCW